MGKKLGTGFHKDIGKYPPVGLKQDSAVEIKPEPEPPTLEQRIELEKVGLLDAQTKLRAQLDGVANQLYIIERLLNPEPKKPPEPDIPVKPEQPTEPGPHDNDLPGTI